MRWRCQQHEVLWSTWSDDEPVKCWYGEMVGVECDTEPTFEPPPWAAGYLHQRQT